MRIHAPLLLISIAALASGAAFAGENDGGSQAVRVESSLSRAAVMKELPASRQSGENPWSTEDQPLVPFQSLLSRDEVRDEYIQHRKEVAAMTGEGPALQAGARQAAFASETLARKQ